MNCLLESLFPEFKVFVGQDDLVFHRTFEMGEIYKIHGSMDNPESMVLEEADYVKLAETQDYLAAKLLTIFMEYPIIFIGYSLNDPDIKLSSCRFRAASVLTILRCLESALSSLLGRKRNLNSFVYLSRYWRDKHDRD